MEKILHKLIAEYNVLVELEENINGMIKIIDSNLDLLPSNSDEKKRLFLRKVVYQDVLDRIDNLRKQWKNE